MLIHCLLSALTLCASTETVQATTIYAVVYGNQKFVVGSSTLHSGLFVSNDTGHTWTQLGPRNLKAFRMDAVDSSRGRILYIAAGNGVHRSTDYGATWRITTTWRTREVLDVKVDQGEPRFVYAATAFGFWRSTDGGEHWEQPPGLLHDRFMYRFDEIRSRGLLRVAVYDAVFESADGGSTWRRMPVADDRGLPIRAIAMPGLPGSSFACLGMGGTPLASVAEGVIEPRRAPALADSNVYDMAFDGDRLYLAGDKGVSVLTPDGAGVTGVRRLPEIAGGVVPHAIVVVGGTLLAGTYGEGVQRFSDGTWVPSGLAGSQLWSLTTKDW